MKICDVHAHVFPKKIAQKAADSIGSFYGYTMSGDGSLEQLLQFHDAAGITHAIIHSVAISPRNVSSINRFISDSIAAYPTRLTGFAAIHPDYDNLPGLMDEVKALGLKGFKIHPDMQKFALDDAKAMDMFAIINESKLPVLIHTGDKRYSYSNPFRMKKVLDAFPKLTCICAHLGGHSEWEDACKLLTKYENAFTDTSSSLAFLTPEYAKSVVRAYDSNRVLFGTDFPMWNAEEELHRFEQLGLSQEEIEKICWKNAEQFI